MQRKCEEDNGTDDCLTERMKEAPQEQNVCERRGVGGQQCPDVSIWSFSGFCIPTLAAPWLTWRDLALFIGSLLAFNFLSLFSAAAGLLEKSLQPLKYSFCSWKFLLQSSVWFLWLSHNVDTEQLEARKKYAWTGDLVTQGDPLTVLRADPSRTRQRPRLMAGWISDLGGRASHAGDAFVLKCNWPCRPRDVGLVPVWLHLN